MVRYLVMLLALCGAIRPAVSLATEPQIEVLNESKFAFDLGGSRIDVEIVDSELRDKKDLSLIHI